jgi:DNA polymerase alpha subunit A
MFELQKPKIKPTRPVQPPPPPAPAAKIASKPIEISLLEESKPPANSNPPSRQEKELDWGDDDSMTFDAVSKLMNDTNPPIKPLSPPRASKSLIQFDTQELEFITDEQLIISAQTFQSSPSMETNNKDEHLRFFWFDAYEDPVAQPGKLFLFGKTPLLNEDKSSSKTFVSVCLIIDNIPKQVFFIPKTGVRFSFLFNLISFSIYRVLHQM